MNKANLNKHSTSHARKPPESCSKSSWKVPTSVQTYNFRSIADIRWFISFSS